MFAYLTLWLPPPASCRRPLRLFLDDVSALCFIAFCRVLRFIYLFLLRFAWLCFAFAGAPEKKEQKKIVRFSGN